jgi:hypothetical protein
MLNTMSLEDLFVLINLNGISIDARKNVLTQIIENYHLNRNFNLYERMIKELYHPSYSLGKAKLELGGRKLQESVFLIDLLTRYEALSEEIMPEEHAKYYFAFIKNFLILLKELVQETHPQTGFEQLAQQLEWIKKIVEKQKNNVDVLVFFESTIKFIREANPLLLASGENQPSTKEKIKFTASVSKLSKKVLVDLFKNLNDYEEPDYYKLVSYAYGKYQKDVFFEAKTTFLPLITTAMKSPSAKLNDFDVFSMLQSVLRDLVDHYKKGVLLSFYPLAINTLEEFIEEVWRFIENLHAGGVVTEKDVLYIKYKLLLNLKTVHNKYASELASVIEKLVLPSVQNMTLFSIRKLSDIDDRKIIYDDHLFLISKNYSGIDDLQFKLVVKGGVLAKLWSPHQKTIKSADRFERDKKEDIKDYFGTEIEVFTNVLRVVRELKPFYLVIKGSAGLEIVPNEEVNFSNALLGIITTVEITLFEQLIVDEMDRTLSDKLPRSFFNDDDGFFSALLKTRTNFKLLTDDEIKLVYGSGYYIYEIKFNDLQTDEVIAYLEQAVAFGCYNFANLEQQSLFLDFKPKDVKKLKTFVHETLRKYDEETVRFIETMINRNDDDTNETLAEKKSSFAYDFYLRRKTKRKSKLQV